MERLRPALYKEGEPHSFGLFVRMASGGTPTWIQQVRNFLGRRPQNRSDEETSEQGRRPETADHPNTRFSPHFSPSDHSDQGTDPRPPGVHKHIPLVRRTSPHTSPTRHQHIMVRKLDTIYTKPLLRLATTAKKKQKMSFLTLALEQGRNAPIQNSTGEVVHMATRGSEGEPRPRQTWMRTSQGGAMWRRQNAWRSPIHGAASQTSASTTSKLTSSKTFGQSKYE